MKKLIMLAAACCMFALNACVNVKTEATVDVEVTQGGKPLSGITVYKFVDKGLGLGIANYKSNATGSAVTNATISAPAALPAKKKAVSASLPSTRMKIVSPACRLMSRQATRKPFNSRFRLRNRKPTPSPSLKGGERG